MTTNWGTLLGTKKSVKYVKQFSSWLKRHCLDVGWFNFKEL